MPAKAPTTVPATMAPTFRCAGDRVGEGAVEVIGCDSCVANVGELIGKLLFVAVGHANCAARVMVDFG